MEQTLSYKGDQDDMYLNVEEGSVKSSTKRENLCDVLASF